MSVIGVAGPSLTGSVEPFTPWTFMSLVRICTFGSSRPGLTGGAIWLRGWKPGAILPLRAARP